MCPGGGLSLSLSTMSGEGGKEAAAGASPAAFCETLSDILGNPHFATCAMIACQIQGTPDQVFESCSGFIRRMVDEKEKRAFFALVRLAFKLGRSVQNIKPEDLAEDPAIWTRLVSDFGVDAEDVDPLRDYAKPKQPVHEGDQARKKKEEDWAHTAFTEYAFLGDAHKHLHEQLKERCQEASKTRYYSPYVAVVQASGVGKSRAVMQLSELGVYICYCSLAHRHSSASPPRTGKLADRLSDTHDEYEMVLYFKAWLIVLGTSIKDGVTANAWKEEQLPLGNGSPRGDVAQRVWAKWEELAAVVRPCNNRVTSHPDELNTRTCKDEVTFITNCLKITDPCSVLFVFDEARGLQIEDPKTGLMNSPFYQARRALRLFFEQKVFFAVFLDTAVRVSNLLPNKSNEDSERALKLNAKLLKPIYCLPNMAHCQPSPGLTAEEYWNPEKWLLYGRPLWGARWKYDSSVPNLLSLAEQKLLGTPVGEFAGMKVDVRGGTMTQSQAVALLSAAAGLTICARSLLAERLAASHMNLILRVTADVEQRRVYVGLAAEPILAEAAGSVLRDARVQEFALKHLDDAFLAGHVTPGPLGEFVTKFILVAAVWKLRENWISYGIPVDTYVETLLGESYLQKLLDAATSALSANAEKLRNVMQGFVFFNSFVITRQSPTEADLGKAFASGYAFMYMVENRLPGADMVIPVCTPEGMTAIIVSAKNQQKAGWLKTESVDKVKSDYTHVSVAKGVTTITLLMSLREPQMEPNENWVHWLSDEGKYIHLSCYGIDRNYRFLHDNVKALLKKVLVTVPDEFGDATDKEKSCIKSMRPGQFDLADEKYTLIRAARDEKRKGTSSEEGAARKQRKVGE